jgi:ABC-type bacteriocin/lantibiotic exporter with double-glycine peptidase domain
MHTKKTLILDFLRRHPFLPGICLLSGLINSLFILLIPVSLGNYYQLVFHSHANRGKILDYVGLQLGKTAGEFLCFFIVLVLLRGLFTFLEKYFTGITGELFSKQLREKLFSHQLSMTLEQHYRKPVGKYLLRYGSNLKSIRNYLTRGIIVFVRDLLFVAISFWVLALLDARLTLLIAGCLPVLFLLIIGCNRRLKSITRQTRNIRSANLSFVHTRLTALTTVKVFNRESIEEENFARRSGKLFGVARQYQQVYSLIYALLPVMVYLLLTLVLFTIYRFNTSGGASVDGGTLITFILLVITLFPILKRILKVDVVWQAGNLSFAKLSSLLNSATEAKTPDTSCECRDGKIVFRHVTFGYMAEKPVLRELSFTAYPQQITRLTGLQGAGKTTLFKLLLRLYEPWQGDILLDGQPLGSYSPKAVRRCITLVSAQVPLLGKTVFEAVSYSRKPEKRPAVLAMLQELRFSPGRYGEPDLDYVIGDSGNNLSAGQQKILMLARALLTGKKVLLLDEPFAGLDAGARKHMVELINGLSRKCTILLIDHEHTPGVNAGQLVTVGNAPAEQVMIS